MFLCLAACPAVAAPGQLHVQIGEELQFSSTSNSIELRKESSAGTPIGRLLLGSRPSGNGRIIISFYDYRTGVLLDNYLKMQLQSGHDVTIQFLRDYHTNNTSDYVDPVPYYFNFFAGAGVINIPAQNVKSQNLGSLISHLRRDEELRNGEYYGFIGSARFLFDSCAGLLLGRKP
jgi:hypothetical protein